MDEHTSHKLAYKKDYEAGKPKWIPVTERLPECHPLDAPARAAERRMIMANCRQACRYNTLEGCKVKEYNKICPLTNAAVPITEYRKTKADRIRAMTDEELADWISNFVYEIDSGEVAYSDDTDQWLFWLQQPAEGGMNNA